MTKQEMASYLASLSTLLKEQDAAGGHLRSAALGEEFNRTWDAFKKEIENESEQDNRTKARTNL